MSAMRIYSLKETPERASNQEWVRLVVRSEGGHDDVEADRLFQELAKLLGGSEYMRSRYVLTKVRAEEVDHPDPSRLPEIINGNVYTGIEKIRSYLERYRSIVESAKVH